MEQIARGVWGIPSRLTLGPGFTLPIRTTVLETKAGLMLISPIQPGAWMEEVERLGQVRWIVAPNGLHHLFAGAAKSRWQEAELVAAPLLKEKRPDLPVQRWLDGSSFPDVEVIPMEGAPDLCESVFFHRPSGSLVVTDLIFNILEPEGALTPWVLRAVGAHKVFMQSRLTRIMVKDRARFAEGAKKILALPVERVVPAHGAVLSTHVREALEAALRWQRRG